MQTITTTSDAGTSVRDFKESEIGSKTEWPKQFVYRSTLRAEYGLTPSMIQELGSPDELVENPHYRNAPLASLYLIARVEAWIEENKERVEKARAVRTKRSAAAKQVHERKLAQTLREETEWVNSAEITCQKPLPDTFLEDMMRRFRFPPGTNCLEKKAVHSYIRHSLTNYNTLISELKAGRFSDDLYPVLRKRVDEFVKKVLVEWKMTHRLI